MQMEFNAGHDGRRGLRHVGHDKPAYWATLAAAPIPLAIDQHPDNDAVDRFAAAMKVKLALSRLKDSSDWDNPEQCSIDDLTVMLRN